MRRLPTYAKRQRVPNTRQKVSKLHGEQTMKGTIIANRPPPERVDALSTFLAEITKAHASSDLSDEEIDFSLSMYLLSYKKAEHYELIEKYRCLHGKEE